MRKLTSIALCAVLLSAVYFGISQNDDRTATEYQTLNRLVYSEYGHWFEPILRGLNVIGVIDYDPDIDQRLQALEARLNALEKEIEEREKALLERKRALQEQKEQQEIAEEDKDS